MHPFPRERSIGRPFLPLRHAAAAALLLALLAGPPAGAGAAELVVPTDYAQIQTAIDAGVAGDSVMVEPGTYTGSIQLKDRVSVRGRETARTFLDLNGGIGPIVTVGSSVTATISSFTFRNASIGIQVSGNTSPLGITNNVFELGSAAGGTAVLMQGSPGVSILNNTFNGNGTAISGDADVPVLSNIFTNNGTAISGLPVLSTNISSNLFFGNTFDGPTGLFPVLGDPIYADPARSDLHLQEGSPCIDTGDPAAGDDVIDLSPNDIGAYGGPLADPTPFPVQDLRVVATTGSSIDLAWSPNRSYLVTNSFFTGGYWVYYGHATGVYDGTDALGGDPLGASPIDVGPYDTYTLLDLSPTFLVPSTPVLDPPQPRDGQLVLTWSVSTGAEGYKVHYGTSSPGENTIDAGNTTTYTLTGLTNGQPYRIAVSAYAGATYYLAVSAYDSTINFNESALSSEVTAPLSQPLESGLSNIQVDYPDRIAPYPLLPDSGGKCFIATAAYGSHDAPEVRVLRRFRDRYLLTSGPGRRFVRWYYEHGPAAAALLNAHPAYKSAVRAALLPAVGAALVLTSAPALFLTGVLLIPCLAALFLVRYRRSGRTSTR